MFPNIPLTEIMSCLSCIVMAVAWLYIGRQIDKTPGTVQRPVHFMHQFFLYMAIFAACISLPYLALGMGSAAFSSAMAWGYVVGHVFCYIAFMYIMRMVFALVPRLNAYDRVVIIGWVVATIVVTAINAKTMIWGVQPVYVYHLDLVELRAAPIVGASIAIMAFVSFVPAIILFGVNTVKSQGARRLKSGLLLGGMLLLMVAGPMHDVARVGVVYAAADVLSMVSMLIIGTGVVYRLQHGLTGEEERRMVVSPSSNTV